MSMASLRITLGRIASATPASPIAVFTAPLDINGSEQYESLFASTYVTQCMIRSNHPGLIGVYHNRMNPDLVKREIMGADKAKSIMQGGGV